LDNTILIYVSDYGYIALVVILALGFMGIPLPEQTTLTFTGFLVSEGGLNYFFAILAATTGIIIGMTFSFFIGHYFGIPFLEKYGYLVGLSKERLKKIESWFNKYGRITLSFGFFVPGLRHFTAYFAGISKWNFYSFAFYIIPGSLIWTTVFITIGMVVGESYEEVIPKFDGNIWTPVSIIIIVFMANRLYRKFKRKKLKQP